MATRKRESGRQGTTHRAPADEHAATELVLYIENTSDLSPDGPQGQGHSVLLNALRKWRKGTYDPARAVKLFEYLAESGAKRYAKDFGSSEKEWSTMFNPATRQEAARQLEESFRSAAESGEYDRVDTRIGGPREEASAPHGESFTQQLSGGYVGRRVEIIRVRDERRSSYFKVGQYGYVVGQNKTGGVVFIDIDRSSEPGEVALLISKTRDMRGGALWFSIDGVRFTGKATREAGESRSEHSMTYGQLPPFEQFEHDVHTRINPDHDRPYWPAGTLYPMELTGAHEIELAEGYGLDEFEPERRRTGRHSGVRGFNADEQTMYAFLEYLVEAWNNEDEEAGDLASSIMTTLGYEWI